MKSLPEIRSMWAGTCTIPPIEIANLAMKVSSHLLELAFQGKTPADLVPDAGSASITADPFTVGPAA
eukprot:4070856-Pyramimonas_sp.AAC.1